MAVDALELRPRNSVALFDAALRLCVTTTGVWAITLPSGAFLVFAVFNLIEAITRNHELLMPVVVFTSAWLARAVSQGAACHYVEQQILGTAQPSVRRSMLEAIKRAPSLVIGSAWLFALNMMLWFFTLGVGFFFIGAHVAGYAAIMRGQGSVLGLYGTCARLLGPTRHFAPWVRLCGLTQVLLGINLLVAVAFSLSLLHNIFGFDVTFADRFTSVDNPTWIGILVVVSFALFEPVRAATATLMLIDGRVRQEGLDLIAQVEQLPRHKRPKGTPLAVSAAMVIALFTLPAFGAPPSALAKRARQISDECGMRVDLTPIEKRTVSPEDQSSLARLLNRVEHRVFEQDDCDAAEADLREGLRLYGELQESGDEIDTQGKAKEILSRPEFENVVERPKEDTQQEPEPPDEPGWFAKLMRKFLKWLEQLFKTERKTEEPTVSSGGTDMAGANLVMIIALVVVAAALIYILARSFSRRKVEETALDESGGLNQQPLEKDAMSALSKPPETWAGLADELAARGEFREAIRHLYLALLSRLHRDGVIDYDPTLSNWEYLFAFKGASVLKAGFKELTRRFDFAWYGNEGVDSMAWSVFRRTAEPMLAPAAEGAPVRA